MRPDWIEGFIEYTENTTSPEIFRLWGGIATVAGALERKVWVNIMGKPRFPNVYVILVGPPGIGKTETTWRVASFWGDLEDHFLASTSVTKASLIDELSEANRRVITNSRLNPVHHFNSLQIAIDELGVFLPSYENDFMNTLTHLWDGERYKERRRTSKLELEIEKPQLNMIAGTTPSYLNSMLPEGAWDQGFIARTMLVYSGEKRTISLFSDQQEDTDKRNRLQSQLETIGNLQGEIKFTTEAAEAADKFNFEGGDSVPDHPKLISYNQRRIVHLVKLCVIASVSRSDSLVIELEDFNRALGWLYTAEARMPEIFKAMSQAGTGKVMELAWHFVFTTHSKEQKPVKKHRLINFLKEHVPVHNIETTINMMEQAKMIEKRLEPGGEAYKPRGRDPQ